MTSCIHSSRVLLSTVKRVQCQRVPVLFFLYDTVTLRRFYSEKRAELGDSHDGSSLTAPRAKSTRPGLHERRAARTFNDGNERDDSNIRTKSPSAPRQFPERDQQNTSPRKQYPERERYNSNPRQRQLSEGDDSEPRSRPRDYTERETTRTLNKGRDTEPSPWGSTPKRSSPRPEVEDHVPFDDPAVAAKPEPVVATTLSTQEVKAFERLRKLGIAKAAAKQESTELFKMAEQTVSEDPPKQDQEPKSESLDDVLKDAMTAIKSQDSSFKRSIVVESVRDRENHRIAELFKTPNTDIELWRMLDNEVLKPIAALNLDNPTNEAQQNKKKVSTKVSRTDRDVIMHNFPVYLTMFCRTLRHVFPKSPLILAVIPTIRNMGPSVFALGASTKLYNQTIGFIFDKLSDIDRIVDIVEEMETEVIEPDAITLKMLDQIMDTWQKIRRGLYGEAARVTWETDKFKRSLASLAKSRAQIETNINKQQASQMSRREKRARTFGRE